ncbi:hypothetical protein B4U79_04215, partial [Dinothrombium tinctorium]
NYSDNFENDIALLHTTMDIPLYPAVNNINSICLPAQDVLFNGRVTVTGWGHVADEGNTSEHLMTVDLNILNDKLCKDQFKSLYKKQIMICAGLRRGGKNSCRGDSGGPLIKVRFGKAYLIGIVSYGGHGMCARENSGAVYTKVSHYTNWIKKWAYGKCQRSMLVETEDLELGNLISSTSNEEEEMMTEETSEKEMETTTKRMEVEVYQESDLTVVAGSFFLNDATSGETKHKVEKIMKHQHYKPKFYLNDIALLKLSNPIRYDRTKQPICLSQKSDVVPKVLTVSGWRKTQENGFDASVLQTVNIKVVKLEKCKMFAKRGDNYKRYALRW